MIDASKSGNILAENAALKSKIAELEALIKHYESQLLMLKRRQFGVSSERIIDGQLSMFGQDKSVPMEPETEEIVIRRNRKRKGKREDDLSGLPVHRIDYELPESERICPQCSHIMGDIGVDVRRELELIPAKVIVTEHATHTYACAHCNKNDITTPVAKATAPPPLISGSLASPSLVAYIATQKYGNGMPLYRLEKGFQLDGINITRQNMANWVIACAERYFEPIYDRLKEYLLKESVLHADETTFQVLKEPERAAQSKSYAWIYRTSGCSNHNIVIFDYQETRAQDHPKDFLRGFQGFLHTDGYQAYHILPPEIIVVGCWAHVRRKWENLLKTLPESQRINSSAATALTYINALFHFERDFADLTPEERYAQRLEKSYPVAQDFFVWVENLGALPKSPLGEAAHYSLSQRKYLENFFLDGRLELSNNRAERSIKPFVIGRKNWLFANTPNGAKASVILYSIMETAKECGLHPYRYLEFLLKTIPASPTGDVENFLPWSHSIPESCLIQQL